MHHKPIYKGSFQEENNMQNIKKKISAAILGGILVLNALLLCACIMLLLNYRKLPVIGLCACIAVAVIFVLFKIILKVPLPMLFLDF